MSQMNTLYHSDAGLIVTRIAGTPAWGDRWQQWYGALFVGPPPAEVATRMTAFAAAWWAYLVDMLGEQGARAEIARCVRDVSLFLAWAHA